MPENNTKGEAELQNLSQDELLALFVEQLLVDKGIEATKELREELANDINDQINIRILNRMPDAAVGRLNAALDNPDTTDEQIDKIIEESGVDVDGIVEQTLVDFRNGYIGNGEEKEVENE